MYLNPLSFGVAMIGKHQRDTQKALMKANEERKEENEALQVQLKQLKQQLAKVELTILNQQINNFNIIFSFQICFLFCLFVCLFVC